jgi:uncharacterized protein
MTQAQTTNYKALYGGIPPITAERAIEASFGIQDHFEREEFLRSWMEGDWDKVAEHCEFKLDTDTAYKAVNFIETYTGRAFFPLAPRVEDVTVIDVAHHLSNQNRYSGATEFYYSTAQHCCLLYDYVEQVLKGSPLDCFQILHHDDAETYLVDMPRPVKQHMPQFRIWDRNIQMCVRSAIGIGDVPIPPWQDDLDSRIIVDERAQVMSESDNDWQHDLEPLGIEIKPWLPVIAEQNFLMRHAISSHKVFGTHQYLRSGWGIPTHAMFKEFPFRTAGSDVTQRGDPDPTLLTDLMEVDLRGKVGRVAMRSPNGMMIRDTRAGSFPRAAWKWIRGDFELTAPGIDGVFIERMPV